MDLGDNIRGRGKDDDEVSISGVELVFDLYACLQDGVLRIGVLAESDTDIGRHRKFL